MQALINNSEIRKNQAKQYEKVSLTNKTIPFLLGL